jgi:transcriptional regulator with XRE-family HTH domain
MSRLAAVFAKRIREMARERHLPLSHVADRSSIAHSHFWAILAARSSPTLAMVERIADTLGVDPLDLLRERGGLLLVAEPQAQTGEARATRTKKRAAPKRARVRRA